MTEAHIVRDEEIIAVAKRLFAALGYDGTSLAQIAESAGTGVASVNERFGGKRELYIEVMKRTHTDFQGAMDKIMREYADADPVTKVHGRLDGLVDFFASHPDNIRLWMHRWLADAADVGDLERMYTQPLIRLIVEDIAATLGLDPNDEKVDLETTVSGFVWCLNGFGTAGLLGEHSETLDFSDPDAARRFRAFLHRMAHHLIGLPGDPP